MNILKNVKQLIQKRAALQNAIEKIDAILAPLGNVDLGDFKTKTALKSGGLRTRKPMSAAVKAKMSAAAKARWKKAKAAGKTRL
jgi:division protein CdvB (Snf7/Vps24/ESCRT-III family)